MIYVCISKSISIYLYMYVSIHTHTHTNHYGLHMKFLPHRPLQAVFNVTFYSFIRRYSKSVDVIGQLVGVTSLLPPCGC